MGHLIGRVIDGQGKPVPNARVDSAAGSLVGSADTDANGTFSESLFPGSAYALARSPPLGLKPPDPEPDSGRILSWVRTWYPGVAFPEAASKILGRPGIDLEIESKLLALSAHTVRGVLLYPDGTPAPKVAMTLGEDRITPHYRVESKPDGTFELPTVADGMWRLFAETESGGVTLRTLEWIEMAGRDVEGLKLRLNPPFPLRGRVVMETREGQPAPKPPPVRLVPMSRGRGQISEPPVMARPAADGGFAVETIYPGPYRLALQDAPPGYYLDAVRLGETDARAPEMELSSALTLTLVYRTTAAACAARSRTAPRAAYRWFPKIPP
jgi:hypothetical protein